MAEPQNIMIVGAGPVGAICALALKQGGLDPGVVEARRADVSLGDPRTLALSYGSRQILERLGVWARLPEPTAIKTIHISHKGGLGRTLLTAQEERVPALGYVLSYGALNRTLDQALKANAVHVSYDSPVLKVTPGTEFATLALGGGSSSGQCTRLAIVADGGRSGQSSQATLQRDYKQVAIVAEVTTERAHRNLAYERFTPDGPIALLPKADGYALVWVCDPQQAERIANLDDANFITRLQGHFGDRQGRFLQVAARGQFPLKLAWRRPAQRPREVLIGNAAQTLHPVAGQGFNLGLRDAFELARMLVDDEGGDPGRPSLLRAFAASRRMDALGGVAFTDILVRAFSNDFAPVKHARGLGLMALQALPPLRHVIARRMLFGSRG
ncbi:MAG: FAD-dependent monooxygenase [Thiobacillaceae bacterium]